jgi:hypothetical protein
MLGSDAGTIGMVWVPISRRVPILGVGTAGVDPCQARPATRRGDCLIDRVLVAVPFFWGMLVKACAGLF